MTGLPPKYRNRGKSLQIVPKSTPVDTNQGYSII